MHKRCDDETMHEWCDEMAVEARSSGDMGMCGSGCRRVDGYMEQMMVVRGKEVNGETPIDTPFLYPQSDCDRHRSWPVR